MADICDDADIVIQEALNRSLSQIPRYSGISSTECVECWELIPEGRRVAIPGFSFARLVLSVRRWLRRECADYE